jgi:hypothetical protein
MHPANLARVNELVRLPPDGKQLLTCTRLLSASIKASYSAELARPPRKGAKTFAANQEAEYESEDEINAKGRCFILSVKLKSLTSRTLDPDFLQELSPSPSPSPTERALQDIRK